MLLALLWSFLALSAGMIPTHPSRVSEDINALWEPHSTNMFMAVFCNTWQALGACSTVMTHSEAKKYIYNANSLALEKLWLKAQRRTTWLWLLCQLRRPLLTWKGWALNRSRLSDTMKQQVDYLGWADLVCNYDVSVVCLSACLPQSCSSIGLILLREQIFTWTLCVLGETISNHGILGEPIIILFSPGTPLT